MFISRNRVPRSLETLLAYAGQEGSATPHYKHVIAHDSTSTTQLRSDNPPTRLVHCKFRFRTLEMWGRKGLDLQEKEKIRQTDALHSLLAIAHV